jgi:hypothetical protein
MKKLLFIAVMAVSALTVNAQFGLKGGLNIANLGGEDVDEEGKKAFLCFYAGFFYNFGCGENFSVQPELVYSNQGARYDDMGYKSKIVLGYINLTPLCRLNTPSGFFVGAGPQLGFLLSAKVKIEDFDDEDIKDELKGIDIGAALAAGYEMPNGFGFYARYNHGFTTLADEGSDKVFNRVLQVGLRYTLNMNGNSKK